MLELELLPAELAEQRLTHGLAQPALLELLEIQVLPVMLELELLQVVLAEQHLTRGLVLLV